MAVDAEVAEVRRQIAAPSLCAGGREDAKIFERYRAEFLLAHQIRTVESRLLQLFKAGKVSGTIHTSIGQEFSAIFVAKCLRPDDVVFSNHRCHGHYIARTGDVRGLIAEIMGKASGACAGRGGSQHLCNGNFFSNGVQGGIVAVSAGIALHQKTAGDGALAVVFVGDGTFGEGVVYESFNIASLWKLPLLVVVEDNGYAQSTASSQNFAGSFRDRARAFGISYYEGSIWDLEDLEAVVEVAVNEVRDTRRPAMLRIDLYRLEAHSKGDDDRDPDEIALYRRWDPLTQFLAQHSRCAETIAKLREIEAGVDRDVAEIDSHDYDALPIASRLQPDVVRWLPAQPDAVIQSRAINAALNAFLKESPTAVLLGEDIHSPYGGAFKVTKGLSDRYPTQVLTTPISEAAIVGIANGLALKGTPAVVEIMFGDFVTLAFDQLVNHAAKFRHMYGTERSFPLVVRMPMGGGRGYGPTHSQSLEKHLAGVPGTQLFVLHGRTHVSRFYADLLRSVDSPTIVIENKLLYSRSASDDFPSGWELWESAAKFPTSMLKPSLEPDITLVAIGGQSNVAEQAAIRLRDEDELVCEIVLPLRLYPLDTAPIIESLRRTKRLVVVEEGARGYDLGAEIVASVLEHWDESAPFRMKRLAAHEVALPSALPLERQVLPSVDELCRLCRELYSA